MRAGVGVKIVATVAAVLVASFAVIAGGSRHLATVSFARPVPPASDAAARLATGKDRSLVRWFRRHRAWTGSDALLRSIAPPPDALVVVASGRVRASSDDALDDAAVDEIAASDTHGATLASLASTPSLRLNLEDARTIEVDGVAAGRLYAVPAPPPLSTGTDFALRFGGGFATLFAVTAAIAIGVALVLARHIVAPLVELTRAARAATSTTIPRVTVRTNDELGDLARAFNALGERLARSEDARRRIVADVAHELRTPLTNVRCALEALQDGVVEPTPAAIESVVADVALLSRLVADLHVLNAGDDAAVALDLREGDLVAETRSVLSAFADRARGRDVVFEVLDASDRVDLICDLARIRQVLYNLLDNAARYGREDGRILVTLARTATEIEVRVTDDGPGFAAADEAAVFERFRRLDASRARTTGGSGLGLAIAKQVVDAHGGRIGARGGDGRGATFWFTLPIAS